MCPNEKATQNAINMHMMSKCLMNYITKERDMYIKIYRHSDKIVQQRLWYISTAIVWLKNLFKIFSLPDLKYSIHFLLNIYFVYNTYATNVHISVKPLENSRDYCYLNYGLMSNVKLIYSCSHATFSLEFSASFNTCLIYDFAKCNHLLHWLKLIHLSSMLDDLPKSSISYPFICIPSN